jgi:hypothetical protein
MSFAAMLALQEQLVRLFFGFFFGMDRSTRSTMKKVVGFQCSSWIGVLGNSGKLVTLETLSLTKFSKHVFQK